ncbi:hypothetical protein MW887_003471 [Aspergillus wentii]|nr:hypothetical protein MW887_003471 [Aspergillus wentii]
MSGSSSALSPPAQYLPHRQRQDDQHNQKQITAAGGDDIRYITASMLHCSISSLLETGKYSDLTVTCGDHKFQVHRAIVYRMDAEYQKETCTNTIDLSEDDPAMLQRFFQFLYTGNYTDGEYFDGLPSPIATMSPEEFREDEEYIDPEDDPAAQPTSILDYKYEGTLEDDDSDEDYIPNPGEPDPEPLQYDSDDSDCPPSEKEHYTDRNVYREQSRIEKLFLRFNNQKRPKKDYPIALFTSLRMYVLADKYSVPALHYLAGLRFRRTAERHWNKYPQFLDVVDELFATTLPSDRLQTWVCQLLAPCSKIEYVVNNIFKPIMDKHPALLGGIERRVEHYAGIPPNKKSNYPVLSTEKVIWL